ncbi:hypothetical protein [Streptomyces sp. H27-S2]|uniref:hypothetical protein n=1 Tax=Streptomyces antarcticus TaxID=2996458 RepID=UPI00226E124F|nr:hypothetical protein [Streptomyces sp. H27-S2]MCY0954292.1 hypothetical protein [Streptomyces sp. H27-S2]
MSDAITHYRQLRELTIDELAYVLLMLDHPISADALAEMERCARPVTVDDLVAIAYVLDTTRGAAVAHPYRHAGTRGAFRHRAPE